MEILRGDRTHLDKRKAPYTMDGRNSSSEMLHKTSIIAPNGDSKMKKKMDPS